MKKLSVSQIIKTDWENKGNMLEKLPAIIIIIIIPGSKN